MAILLNKPVNPDLKILMGYLEKVNEIGWYTSFGPLYQELTSKLEDYVGVQNLLLVTNATIGVQVAYRALGIKKAICTPFSFAATASSLSWEKKLYNFVDIDKSSLNLSVPLVEEISRNQTKLMELLLHMSMEILAMLMASKI